MSDWVTSDAHHAPRPVGEHQRHGLLDGRGSGLLVGDRDLDADVDRLALEDTAPFGLRLFRLGRLGRLRRLRGLCRLRVGRRRPLGRDGREGEGEHEAGGEERAEHGLVLLHRPGTSGAMDMGVNVSGSIVMGSTPTCDSGSGAMSMSGGAASGSTTARDGSGLVRSGREGSSRHDVGRPGGRGGPRREIPPRRGPGWRGGELHDRPRAGERVCAGEAGGAGREPQCRGERERRRGGRPGERAGRTGPRRAALTPSGGCAIRASTRARRNRPARRGRRAGPRPGRWRRQ